MELTIAPDQRIKDIQQEFQKRFPYLKIEFFENGKPASPKTIVDSLLKIGSIIQSVKTGQLKIDGLTKVKELEKMFTDAFGIHAQVFRKSGSVWLQTSSTDEWTLSEQNQEGREADKVRKEKPDETDYHEQE